jgi:hypothetical protein
MSSEIEWPGTCRRPEKQQMEAERYAEAAEAAETAAGKPKVGFSANWHFRSLICSAVIPPSVFGCFEYGREVESLRLIWFLNLLQEVALLSYCVMGSVRQVQS